MLMLPYICYQDQKYATGFPNRDTIDTIVSVKNAKDNLPPTHNSKQKTDSSKSIF